MEACGEEVPVKLLGWNTSPFVLRVRMALALKGIAYEFIGENIYENNHKKSELLLKSNPVNQKIPVLFHNGKPVCESMIIVQYIDEAWENKGPNLMPKDPYDRAIARFWTAFIDDKGHAFYRWPQLEPCLRELFRSHLYRGHGEQQKAVEESVANFLLLEENLRTNHCFSGKPYFGGDEVGVVDIALGGTSAFVKALEKATNSVLIDAEKMPLLSAWIDRICEADRVKEIMPDPAMMLEFLSAMRLRFASPH